MEGGTGRGRAREGRAREATGAGAREVLPARGPWSRRGPGQGQPGGGSRVGTRQGERGTRGGPRRGVAVEGGVWVHLGSFLCVCTSKLGIGPKPMALEKLYEM